MSGYLSPLGLDRRQRYAIRGKAMDAAVVAYHHHGVMRYSEGPDRWSGIAGDKRAYRGQYPQAADCSAACSWILWDATRAERLGDFVNGVGWSGGFTGTMTSYGQQVRESELLRADLVFYGGSLQVPAHVAMYIGNGRVFSHGSPGGPRILPVHYRSDVTQFRRYIR
jgi:hypothetical protein